MGYATTTPDRSLQQRRDALEIANEVRTYRRILKEDLTDGQISVTTVLMDPPELVETMKVAELLLAVPKYGRTKVHRILQQHRISPSKTVGGLTERQRRELISSFGGVRYVDFPQI